MFQKLPDVNGGTVHRIRSYDPETGETTQYHAPLTV